MAVIGSLVDDSFAGINHQRQRIERVLIIEPEGELIAGLQHIYFQIGFIGFKDLVQLRNRQLLLGKDGFKGIARLNGIVHVVKLLFRRGFAGNRGLNGWSLSRGIGDDSRRRHDG